MPLQAPGTSFFKDLTLSQTTDYCLYLVRGTASDFGGICWPEMIDIGFT